MVAFLALLVELGVFVRIEIHTLSVGHTHCQIDQLFSVVHRHLHNRNVISVPDLISAVGSLFKTEGKFNVTEEVTDILDMDELKKNLAVPLKGLGTVRDPVTKKKMSFHSMRFEKPSPSPSPSTSTSSHGLNCGIVYRLMDEGGSQADNGWVGHWQFPKNPIPVFLPGKVVGDIPKRLPPGNRLRLADVDEYKKRYAAVFDAVSTAEERVQRLPGAAEGVGTTINPIAKKVRRPLWEGSHIAICNF
jgi:hypothetical protein